MKTKKTKRPPETVSLTRKDERKTDRVFKTIRRLALKQQTDTPQLFLSLRQAAQRFDVPVSAMATVYRRLIDEGILGSIRASRTVLLPRDAGRKLTVRGVIGIPLSWPRLHTLRDYRECYLRIRHELHSRGFSITPLYFEEREIASTLVVERAKKEKADIVIWLLPDGAERDTPLRLRDAGIAFIGVNIGGVSAAFCRYEVRRRQAILTILQDWRAGLKMDAAVIVLAGPETAAEKERMARLRRMVSMEHIDCQLVPVPEGRISRFLKSLCAKKNEGILLPAPASAMLGTRAPDTVAEVLKTCHVALVDGPPDASLGQGIPDVSIDLVSVDWRAIGERIARDILSGDAFNPSETTIFEGKAHLKAPLKKYLANV